MGQPGDGLAENLDVARFQSLARGYCDWLESGEQPGLVVLGRWLGDLISAGLALPEPDVSDDDDVEPPDLERDVAVVGSHLRGWLSADYYYSLGGPLVLDDATAPPEPTVASLFDDVVDTYRDLRTGLHQVEIGRPGDGVFCWRFGLTSHWGRHAASALTPILDLIADTRMRGLSRGE